MAAIEEVNQRRVGDRSRLSLTVELRNRGSRTRIVIRTEANPSIRGCAI